MTRISLIRQEQTGGDGGAQAIIDIMLQVLGNNAAIDLSLLCRKWEADTCGAKKIIINPCYRGRKDKQTSFNRAIKQYLTKQPFDLVQSHERLQGCHIFRAGDGVHKVWLQQKNLASNALQRWWLSRSSYHRALLEEEKAMYESSALRKVICNSNMVKQEIAENFAIAEEKLCVIYNGVDTDHYKPVTSLEKASLRQSQKIPEEALVFIFAGSGFARKNLKTTLIALSQLGPQCHLLVVGRDKKMASYQALAKQLGCKDRVHFIGSQTRKKMPLFYQMADVLVLPTLYDPFPNVILEGLACGLPCITSTKCGAIDIIPTYQCGEIIDALNIEQLTEKMQQYNDEEIHQKHSTNALNAIQHFSKNTMQEKLFTLYAEMLDMT